MRSTSWKECNYSLRSPRMNSLSLRIVGAVEFGDTVVGKQTSERSPRSHSSSPPPPPHKGVSGLMTSMNRDHYTGNSLCFLDRFHHFERVLPFLVVEGRFSFYMKLNASNYPSPSPSSSMRNVLGNSPLRTFLSTLTHSTTRK